MSPLLVAVALSLLGSLGGLLLASALLLFREGARMKLVPWLVSYAVGTLLGVFGAILVAYVLYTAVAKLPSEDRDRIFAAMFLIVGSILFWALFEQAGSSINLFTDRHVDRGGVPASLFQSMATSSRMRRR